MGRKKKDEAMDLISGTHNNFAGASFFQGEIVKSHENGTSGNRDDQENRWYFEKNIEAAEKSLDKAREIVERDREKRNR